MKNVALFGPFASGKTTIANALGDLYGYKRVSMAANMKQLVFDAYGTLDKSAEITVKSRLGEDKVLTIREILQGVGESIKKVDRDIWLRMFLRDAEVLPGPLVMDDARLQFEADALKALGWLLVKVETPEAVRMERYFRTYGRKPKVSELNHPTETELLSIVCDLTVDGAALPELVAEQIQRWASR